METQEKKPLLPLGRPSRCPNCNQWMRNNFCAACYKREKEKNS